MPPAAATPGAAPPARRTAQRSSIVHPSRSSPRADRGCASRGSSIAATRRPSTFKPDQMKTWMDTRAYGELAVVAAVHHSRTAGRRSLYRGRDLQRAGHVRAARHRQRRIALHLRQRHGNGHTVATGRENSHHEDTKNTKQPLGKPKRSSCPSRLRGDLSPSIHVPHRQTFCDQRTRAGRRVPFLHACLCDTRGDRRLGSQSAGRPRRSRSLRSGHGPGRIRARPGRRSARRAGRARRDNRNRAIRNDRRISCSLIPDLSEIREPARLRRARSSNSRNETVAIPQGCKSPNG